MEKGVSHKLRKLTHQSNNEVDLVEGSYSSYSEEWPQVMFKMT